MIRFRILRFIAHRCWDAGDLLPRSTLKCLLLLAGDRAWQAADKARKA